ncbi:ferredoxin--NADP(+) reductase [Yersinia pseudotuberculosis]|uniref:Carnitine monooxygenase reductase subunit n=1 Tax=Yersinia pseudotuberculosis TaxID=633 RepID=A0A380QAA3_YERPU|nr:PDR/VanB family oxidoreductase [Yersinia pseudotuberculosis]PSH14271.1 ferredoxin--NADP(+) reductase [Yersinia pseudotuberculosis]SUP84031.1 putative dioxygenase subunit beta [Yersinia pseudotuberculosis]
MASHQMFDVVVSKIEVIKSDVKRFTLTAGSDRPLPVFEGGSHILVQIPLGERNLSNAYSLMNSPFETHRYQIAVRCSEHSRGGADFMHHHVKVGDKLRVSGPNNLFPLVPEAQRHLLIAGGIGITPFISQLYELERRQDHYHLHYCFRRCDDNAFQSELENSAFAKHLSCHISSQGSRLDVARLLVDCEPDTHIYTCGSVSLNNAVKTAATQRGIPQTYLHFEQFTAENQRGGEFTLVLARSGVELNVGCDMTILQAIENSHAAQVECLCREGICGTCETAILEGEADHRDRYLTDEEKKSQKSILICCSRAKGARLVLDL